MKTVIIAVALVLAALVASAIGAMPTETPSAAGHSAAPAKPVPHAATVCAQPAGVAGQVWQSGRALYVCTAQGWQFWAWAW